MENDLLAACKEGDLPRVELLLNANPAAVHERGKDGWTPLHFAVAYGHTYVAQRLLDAYADVNARTRDGSTPLHFAVYLEDARPVVQMLLAAGGDVDARDRDGDTSLLEACLDASRPGVAELVKLLLDRKADLRVQNHEGQTAMHRAVASLQRSSRALDVVELLLAAGADPTVRDKQGRLPRDLAGASDAARALLDGSRSTPFKKRTELRGLGARGGRRPPRDAELADEEF